MPQSESVPQETPQGEAAPKLLLTENIVQIAFAKQWFNLHPEIAKQFEITAEHPKVSGSEILQAWIDHDAARTYGEYKEYAERNEIAVDITNPDEINTILRDMGILKTIH